MLRYIETSNDGQTTTEQFIMPSGSIWLAKNSSQQYGVGSSKQISLKELVKGGNYAHVECPDWLILPGDDIKYCGYSDPYCGVPGANRFIETLLPVEYFHPYTFKCVYSEDFASVALVITSNVTKNKPAIVITTSEGIIAQQVRRCIYQFYIELDRAIEDTLTTREIYIKHREWLEVWFKKLPAKAFSD